MARFACGPGSVSARCWQNNSAAIQIRFGERPFSMQKVVGIHGVAFVIILAS
jgi:hypothetical protein